MHVTVTDVLACPRCGPESGLILLADEVHDRRVRLGTLGCPNCRSNYPIEAGIATLERPIPDQSDEPTERVLSGTEGRLTQALEWAALLGVDGPGKVLIAGPAVRHARELADLIPEVEIVAIPESIVGDERPGSDPAGIGGAVHVSVVRTNGVVPVRPGAMAAAALSGDSVDRLLEQAVRTVRRGGRVVVDPAAPDAADRLRASGARILTREADTIVAVVGIESTRT